MSISIALPNGEQFITNVPYTARELGGVTILIAASSISMAAVCGLLIAISLSAFNTRKSNDKNLFVRTHVAAYFISLLLCDLLQAVGSIMNEKWVQNAEVYIGQFCTMQGTIKQASDVGTAVFTLVIAIHTFFVLFLRWQMRTYVLWLTLIAAWSGIAAIVLAGPAALNTTRDGPFFGISGYWCWISEGYPTERVTLDYMTMFISALFSFILYSLVFLRLRGNIVVSGWYIAFRKANKSKNASWRGRDFADNQMMAIARQMLLYPVAYTIIILPIAAARFTSFAGKDVPFAATIFCDTVFLCSGTVNVILFTTTRRVLPPKSIITGRFVISRPKLVESSLQADPEAFYRTTITEKDNHSSMEAGPPSSIFKRSDSFVSISDADDSSHGHLSISTNYTESIPQALGTPQLHMSMADAQSQARAMSPPLMGPPPIGRGAVRESGESMYDLYADRRSEMPGPLPRITEDEYRRSTLLGRIVDEKWRGPQAR